MELEVGMTFTGSEQCFGRVEVLEIDEPNNRLRVGLTKKHDTFTSNWNEDWDLQHTIWGFERGDCFVKNFTDYPQEIKNGNGKGYEIGKAISIHTHINDSESWFVTIRPLQIFGQSLCKKDCTEAEIARYVNVLLHKKLNIISELIKDVEPFT